MRSPEDIFMSVKKAAHSLPPAASKFLDRNLSLYSVAAAAAGVSVLALATPAEGKVVVITKTIHLPLNQVVSLDLNRDGITDFQFDLQYIPMGCESGGSLTVQMPAGNAVERNHYGYVSALVRGAKIGADQFTGSGARAVIEQSFVEYCSGSSRRSLRGNWNANPPNRYIGVKFLIHGATHFGWIRITVDFRASGGFPPAATITAYSYETVTNKSLSAGSRPAPAVTSASNTEVRHACASLGALALGSDGLAIWRREETLSAL